jgi:hypothetical protein
VGLYNIAKMFADDTLATGRPPAGSKSGGEFLVDFDGKSPELAGENRFGRR